MDIDTERFNKVQQIVGGMPQTKTRAFLPLRLQFRVKAQGGFLKVNNSLFTKGNVLSREMLNSEILMMGIDPRSSQKCTPWLQGKKNSWSVLVFFCLLSTVGVFSSSSLLLKTHVNKIQLIYISSKCSSTEKGWI